MTKKLNRTFIAVFAFIMSAFILSGTVFKAEAAKVYKSGNYTYTVKNNKAVITDVSVNISGAVTVPSKLGSYTVEVIGEEAFEDARKITSVTIPKTVKTIGDSAFENCISLKTVKFSEGLAKIGEEAFNDCNKLKSVTIPKSVTYIGEEAFGFLDDNVKVKNFKLICYKGTTGESYAKRYNISYTSKDDKTEAKPSNGLKIITNVSFNATETRIRMSWKKVSGATGYRVYKYNETLKKWEKIANTTDTTYVFTNLSAGTTYKLTVKAYKHENGKAVFASDYKTFSASTDPLKVKFTLSQRGDEIDIRWNRVKNATGYKVYVKNSPNGKWKLIETTDDLSTDEDNFRKGTYYFAVKAYKVVDGKVYSGAYDIKSIKIK